MFLYKYEIICPQEYISHRNFLSDECIMKCCMDHGLPQQCLGEDLNFNTVTNHNTSHLVVKTVISKQCHKYKGIMEDCKTDCLDKKTTQPPIKSSMQQYSFILFLINFNTEYQCCSL